MIKIIEFLKENPNVLALMQQEKVSLVGVNEQEAKAITEAFEMAVTTKSAFWK